MVKGFAHESPVNKSVEWYTPKEVFDALGVEFDLDPCSPGKGLSFVPARHHLTQEEDGLATSWDDYGLAFVNPPYGKLTRPFIEKLRDHGNGIALVFARTDPQWFQAVAEDASAVCFISGRIRFYAGSVEESARATNSPGAGSMLVAFGEEAGQAVLGCGLGVCMKPVRARAR